MNMNEGEDLSQSTSEGSEPISEGMTRRQFLRLAILGGASAAFLAACRGLGLNNIPDEEKSKGSSEPTDPDTQGSEVIDPQVLKKYEYDEAGLVLLKDPKKLDSSEFIMGDPQYPTALTEGTKLDGKYLIYGESLFEEVTYLHYIGKTPPVAGELIPLMYPVPKDVRRLDLVPYAISANRGFPKSVELDPNSEYFVVPIITTGKNRGIVPSVNEGKIVNAPNVAFPVEPDPVSYDSHGYFSWALFTREGDSMVFHGVVDNSNMYIDYNGIPEEISRILNSN